MAILHTVLTVLNLALAVYSYGQCKYIVHVYESPFEPIGQFIMFVMVKMVKIPTRASIHVAIHSMSNTISISPMASSRSKTAI